MNDDRVKAVLIFGTVFVAGMATGAAGLIWLLNRDCDSDRKKS